MTRNTTPIRLVVLSLCRDCETTLPPFLAMLDALDADPQFEVHAIFGENGSRDGTRALLQQMAKAPRRQWIDTAFMAQVPERLARMAQGREALRHALPPAQPGDVVMVADPDLHFSPALDPARLRAALDELAQDGVTGLCSHSIPRHYDILALEIEPGDPNPALAMYMKSNSARSLFRKLLDFPMKFSLQRRIRRRQSRIGTGSGLRAVSAFNGFCLYERVLFDKGTYLGKDIQCEHVTLHRTLNRITSGKVLVSGHIGVTAPNEHLRSEWCLFVDSARAIRASWSSNARSKG